MFNDKSKAEDDLWTPQQPNHWKAKNLYFKKHIPYFCIQYSISLLVVFRFLVLFFLSLDSQPVDTS